MYLDIYCNNDNCSERAWIIDVIFREFLHIDYRLHFVETEYYEIHYKDKVLLIEDHFFKQFPAPLQYLSRSNIPIQVDFETYIINNKKFPLVILYGNNTLDLCENKLLCGVDLFASSFFMLSRWEEYCIDKRDTYGTCDESELLSVRLSFFKRPLVDEYVCFLKELLCYIEFPCRTTKYKRGIYLTYDVDDLFFMGTRKIKSSIRSLAGDIIRRRNVKTFVSRLIFYLNRLGKDLYDPFEEIVKESKGLSPLFHFKAQFKSELGATYDIRDSRIDTILQFLVKNGCHIGLHSSEIAYNLPVQLRSEISRLRTKNKDIYCNRNHLLLYDLSNMNILHQSGILLDSTFGFHYHNGFRCGTCHSYSMYNYLSRVNMNIIQLPFTIKDTGSFYIDNTPETMWHDIVEILDTIKYYDGDVVLLWHTNKLNTFDFRQYKKIHFQLISYLKDTCL